MFDDSAIHRFLLSYTRNPAIYEVEARLGRFDVNGKNFTSGVSQEDFDRMIKFHQKELRSETSVVTQRYSGQMRYEKDKVVKKEPIDRFDVHEFDVRVSLSRETVQQNSSMNEHSILQVICYTRVKKRTSFFISRELRLDFTEVTTTQGDALDGPTITYEVELEVISDITVSGFRSALENLLKYWKSTHFILPKSKTASLEKAFCNLAKVKYMGAFTGAQPRTMQIDDISLLDSHPYAFTYKIDGVRTYLFITHRGMVLLITPGPAPKIKQIAAIETNEFDGTILDGEFSKKYYAFDTIFWKGRDLRDDVEHRSLLMRLSFLDVLARRINLISKKEYHFGDSFAQLSMTLSSIVSKFTMGDDVSDEDIDGIILVPVNECYPRSKYWKGLLKWKPKVTIDFRVHANRLYVGSRPMDIEFKPEDAPKAGVMLPLFTPASMKCIDGEIYECCWDSNLKSFVPLRHRKDKLHPNFITVALDNFHAIKNPVTLPMLTGEEYTPASHESSTTNRTEKYMVSISDAVNILQTPKNHIVEDRDSDYPVCSVEPNLELPIQLPTFKKRPGITKETFQNPVNNNPAEWDENNEDDENTNTNVDDRFTDDAAIDDQNDSGDDSDDSTSSDDNAIVSKKRDSTTQSQQSKNSPKPVVKRRRTSKPVVLLLGTPLKDWRLAELKAACVERDLKAKGKKSILIEQLQNWENANGAV